ncbi:MAG: DUF3267 domain-containing protein [Anaerolineales bacterium]|nr:DUF3267 domain-containing protein [Anaerolineales bacterium]
MKLAAWFHDVVYDPKANDNEAQSAAYAQNALQTLGLEPETIAAVQHLILSTQHHNPQPDDLDAQILADADLAILGAASDEFGRYAQAIHAEYVWVPEAIYRRERGRVLKAFLGRPRLYYTQPLHERFEAQARANLKSEIQQLQGISMNPTKTLPEAYQQLYSLDLSKNILALIALNAAALPIFFIAGWVFIRLSIWLRPAYWQGGEILALGLGELIGVLIAIVLMLVIHEAIHGIFFWIFTKERPRFGFHGLYAYAAAPDWYLPRNKYLVVGLAPLVLISVVGVLVMPITPLVAFPALFTLLVLNAAGAIGDIYVTLRLLFGPEDVFVNDHGDKFAVFGRKIAA